MKNRRGVSIGINVIVIMAIALIVLLIVTGFFLGGFKGSAGGIKEVSSGAETIASERNVSAEIENATVYSGGEEIESYEL